MKQRRRIFVAGYRGMVGSALVRRLETDEGIKLVLRTRAEVDLTRQKHVEDFLGDEHIDEVYLAAARVGGISANDRFPADFIYENLIIEANVIHAAHEVAVGRLLLLGSSCIYPRAASQPMREEALLNGPLELTNEPYAVAKIAGIKLCESYNRQHGTDFRSIMPTNLYGPNDNFDLETSHVLPALLRKAHQAKLDGAEVVGVWGSGNPRREFLHVDDLADACVHLLGMSREKYWSVAEPRCSHINAGTGKDISIRELAELVCEIAEFKGKLEFNAAKPDGTPRKLLDVGRMERLGWRPSISLRVGIASTYAWMVDHWDQIAGEA
jgi:GDP-L-fucose synthase